MNISFLLIHVIHVVSIITYLVGSAKTNLFSTYDFLLVCAFGCLEWTHRPSQRKEFSVSCDTEITGEEERNDVSFHFLYALYRQSVIAYACIHKDACGHTVTSNIVAVQDEAISAHQPTRSANRCLNSDEDMFMLKSCCTLLKGLTITVCSRCHSLSTV